MKAYPRIPIQATEALAKMAAKATPREGAYLADMVEHYLREFRRAGPEGGPLDVAYTVHGLVDEAMERLAATDPNAPRVVCSKGCSACCHLRVTIDKTEAALLVAWLREEGVEIDRARLERQAGQSLAQWRDLAHADRACVFLDDAGACRVYEHRPNACRKYLVIDDAALCDTQRHPGGRVGILASPEAEAITTAAFISFERGALADLVLDGLRATDEPA